MGEMHNRTLARIERAERADRAILSNPRATAEQRSKAEVDLRYQEINRHGVERPNENMPYRAVLQGMAR